MNIDNLTLAYLCNDLDNAQDYKIIGNLAYHKDKLIGEIREELNGNYLDVYFKPEKPIESITVNIVINKDDSIDGSKSVD